MSTLASYISYQILYVLSRALVGFNWVVFHLGYFTGMISKEQKTYYLGKYDYCSVVGRLNTSKVTKGVLYSLKSLNLIDIVEGSDESNKLKSIVGGGLCDYDTFKFRERYLMSDDPAKILTLLKQLHILDNTFYYEIICNRHHELFLYAQSYLGKNLDLRGIEEFNYLHNRHMLEMRSHEHFVL